MSALYRNCMRSLLLIFLAAVWTAQIQAQSQPAAPPPDPQLGQLPHSVVFTKKYSYPIPPVDPNATDEEKALQQFRAQFAPVEKLEITKTGDIRKEVEHFTNGTSNEKWLAGQTSFITSSLDPNQIIVTAPGMTPGTVAPESTSDFAELSWVNAAAFKGEEVRQGVSCYVYRDGDQTAWLDQTLRLPVAFQSSKMQVAYSYKPGPEQPLTLPDKLTKKLEAVKRAWMGGGHAK